MTICVFDSNPSELIATKNTLERAGFSAVVAANAQDALEKSRVVGCRVILADCKMMGGAAFLERASQKNPGVHCLLMSATHSVDAAIDAIKHGAYDFLCKPLDYPRLVRTLDELAAQADKPPVAATSAGENWRPLPLCEIRRIHIRRVLETCHGNRVRAARMLGIGRTSLYRFLKSSEKHSAAGTVA